jgi:hypothetical protein
MGYERKVNTVHQIWDPARDANRLEVIRGTNTMACETRCNQLSTCTHFNYNNDKTLCVLFQGRTDLQDAKHNMDLYIKRYN